MAQCSGGLYVPRNVALKIQACCGTYATLPKTLILPLWRCISPKIAIPQCQRAMSFVLSMQDLPLSKALLPAPTVPTIPTAWPCATVKLMFDKENCVSLCHAIDACIAYSRHGQIGSRYAGLMNIVHAHTHTHSLSLSLSLSAISAHTDTRITFPFSSVPIGTFRLIYCCSSNCKKSSIRRIDERASAN
jgi:hypothetical protein